MYYLFKLVYENRWKVATTLMLIISLIEFVAIKSLSKCNSGNTSKVRDTVVIVDTLYAERMFTLKAAKCDSISISSISKHYYGKTVFQSRDAMFTGVSNYSSITVGSGFIWRGYLKPFITSSYTSKNRWGFGVYLEPTKPYAVGIYGSYTFRLF